MVYKALLAASELDRQGMATSVINLSTIKPLGESALFDAARQSGAIVTVEEHQVAGGLGSAVAELLSGTHPVPIKMVGIRDRFGESGPPQDLLVKFGLTKE